MLHRCFFGNGHIHNVENLDVENENVASTLPNIVYNNFEVENLDLTLLDVVNSNIHIHTVVSTLT